MKEAEFYCELHRVYINMFIDAYILKYISQTYVDRYLHLHKCVNFRPPGIFQAINADLGKVLLRTGSKRCFG